MVLPIPDLEPRLQRRYQQLVKEHLHTSESVAAGPSALPGGNQAFASTQAAWRFYANPRVALEELLAHTPRGFTLAGDIIPTRFPEYGALRVPLKFGC